MGKKAIQKKAEQVDLLAEKFKKAQLLIVYDYRTLSVLEVSKLRNQFREVGIEYRVIKNNILRRAAEKINIEGFNDLTGPTGIVFGYEDPVTPAKILVEYIKQIKRTKVKFGILNGEKLDDKAINALASLPSREEMLAKILGSLTAPMTGFAMVLSAIPRSLVYALNAVKEQKQA